jgi:hypothetical protein
LHNSKDSNSQSTPVTSNARFIYRRLEELGNVVLKRTNQKPQTPGETRECTLNDWFYFIFAVVLWWLEIFEGGFSFRNQSVFTSSIVDRSPFDELSLSPSLLRCIAEEIIRNRIFVVVAFIPLQNLQNLELEFQDEIPLSSSHISKTQIAPSFHGFNHLKWLTILRSQQKFSILKSEIFFRLISPELLSEISPLSSNIIFSFGQLRIEKRLIECLLFVLCCLYCARHFTTDGVSSHRHFEEYHSTYANLFDYASQFL